ncbi:MAG: hypothetical protein RQ756_05235, partial [Flavobacteriaceae bacterium]|nr:hypothetical protein [Flavobacteriaceae bacterium]
LLFIFKLLLPYTLQYFSSMEIFFINSVGLPFHSGSIIAGILLFAAFYYALKYTRQNGLVTLNTLTLCILFILIGFSSWVMLPIRANAGPPINENRPDNARELLAYYNREQYPETHLFYGPMFTDIYGGLDPKRPYLDAKPNYEKDEALGKYVIVNQYKNALQNTEDKHKGLLPRMWSADRASNYIQFMGGLNLKPLPQYANNIELNQSIEALQNDFKEGLLSVKEYERYITEISPFIEVAPPSLWQNLDYMFRFQFSYMYGRYFMWNFVGRQNDIQGEGGILNGNWLSGISFIDEARLGNQSELSGDMRNNKARNTYFFLPFILGLIGVFFHFNRDLKSFWVLLLFFLFTGLALKFYLNERMYEVRERDYALVGSYYVFALWMGYGIYAIYQKLASKLTSKIALSLTGVIAFIAGPAILAQQNWDDHDRSGKYSARFLAKSYLDSCDENALIFTIGDNDTFGIWYAQEIEGYRTDVRVINTSLFAKDWYIDDMKKQAYESDPIPSQLSHKQYRDGSRDYIFLDEKTTDTLDIKDWMKWVASESPKQKVTLQNDQIVNTFPTKYLKIPVDKEKVLQNGIVAPEDADQIVDYLYLTIKSQILYKNRILMLDILANNHWERPIYFSGGSYAEDEFLWLKDYIQLEGNALKLVPIKTPVNKNNPYEFGRVNALKSYEIIKSWDWGNMGSPDIYHDPETRKNAVSFRSLITRVAEVLMQQGHRDKAKELLDIGMQHMPVAFYDKYTLVEPFVSGYYELDEPDSARAVFEQLEIKYQELLTYYSSLSIPLQEQLAEDIIIEIERYRSLVDVVIIYGDKEIMKDKVDAFNEHLKLFSHFYGEDRSTQLPDEEDPMQDSVPELDSLEIDF